MPVKQGKVRRPRVTALWDVFSLLRTWGLPHNFGLPWTDNDSNKLYVLWFYPD